MKAILDQGQTLKSEQERYLFSCLDPYYDEPLLLSQGIGSWVTDSEASTR